MSDPRSSIISKRITAVASPIAATLAISAATRTVAIAATTARVMHR